MPRDLGLAARLRARGLTVVEVAGWQTRGSSTFDPRGSVNHHTAGSPRGNAPSLGGVINGHDGLPGPLSQVFMARDATVYVVAAGRANHAGRGGWRGLSGNASVYGVENENVGYPTEPWSQRQLDVMVHVHAAFLEGTPTRDAELCCQHKEWAPTRKIDAHSIDGDAFRARVAAALRGPTTPPTPPVALPLEANMSALIKGAEQAPWYVTDGVKKRWVLDRAEAQFLVAARVVVDTRTKAQQDAGAQVEPTTLPQQLADRIPLVVVGGRIPGGYEGAIAES